MTWRRLFQSPNTEEKTERKKRKSVCKITQDGNHLGWGCLVFDPPQVKNADLSKYFIITSSKAIPKENFDAEKYQVEFEKPNAEQKSFQLGEIAKTRTVHHVAPGLVAIAIDSKSCQLNHGCGKLRRRCSVLKNLPQTGCKNSGSQFFYIDDKRYDVESDGEHVLEISNHDFSSTECCSVLLEGNDGDVKAVGIVNLEDNGQSSIVPIWLQESSLQASLEAITTFEPSDDKVPAEIAARGPWAVNAYKKAIEEGSTLVMRVPIMLIGQGRSGKTSLKRSLTGEKFKLKEEPTDSVEKSASYFSVTKELWKTGERNKEPDSDSAVSLPNRIAQTMMNEYRENKHVEKHEILLSQDQPSTSGLGESVGQQAERKSSDLQKGKENQEEKGQPEKTQPLLSTVEKNQEPRRDEPRKIFLKKDQFPPSTKNASPSLSTESEDLVGKTDILNKDDQDQLQNTMFIEGNMKDTAVDPRVPEETAQYLEKLLRDPERENEGRVYSVLWDFGGQSVYYATHPLFLTSRAIYLLVYDLGKIPLEKASPVENQGRYGPKEDHNCKKTNEDYLHFWLSSVATLSSKESDKESFQSGKLPETLPPVLLVCTHADECGDYDNAKQKTNQIYGSLNDPNKAYSKHLYKHFTVNNTLSGSERMCPGVEHLRKVVCTLAKQLLQNAEPIPIKWLKFEEELKALNERGSEPFISLEEARRVAKEKCKIYDKDQFDTVMNFLHDQRILIHFDNPDLERMVILDPQWLIDLFKSVITVKPYNPEENEEHHKQLWEKLETDAILDDELLQFVWRQRLEKASKETTDSLVAIMKRFSLLCTWPSQPGQSKQYLVPSMLMSHPDECASELCASDCRAPLFIRFRQPYLLGDLHGATKGKSDQGYIQVPMGFFPRFLLKFTEWCLMEGFIPYEKMYQTFARFAGKGYSVIIRCHSSFIEIRALDTTGGTSDCIGTICHMVLNQVQSILQETHKEFFWFKTMQYKLCVLCPVCCEFGKYLVICCPSHEHKCCSKEDCLHFLPLSELREGLTCRKATFSSRPVEVKVEDFRHWLQERDDVDSCVGEGSSTSPSEVRSDVYSELPVDTEECLSQQMPAFVMRDNQESSNEKFSSEQEIIMPSTVSDNAVNGVSSQDPASQKQVAPPEILARGPLAIEAYNKALMEETTCLRRFPVMFIGQDRAGKTSLKNSLLGNYFNPDEDSTVGVDVDPSYFKVSTAKWKTCRTVAEESVHYNDIAARLIAKDLICVPSGDIRLTDTVLPRVNSDSDVPGTSNHYVDSLKGLQSTEASKRSEAIQTSRFTESVDRKVAPRKKEENPLVVPEIPEEIATLIEKLLKEGNNVEHEEDIYATFWDFGGESVSYTTHPLFLSTNAIYLLVYNLSRNPHGRAIHAVKQGMFTKLEDSFGLTTNLDYLDFWMSSVAGQTNEHEEIYYDCVCPPVFLVCTHADMPYGGGDPAKIAREVFASLLNKPYSSHLYKDVFVVDNTWSGGESECPEIIRLRKELHEVAKELPVVPIKWLKYEQILQTMKTNGQKWISLERSWEIAFEICIVSEEEFVTLLKFLHDQKILIHFDGTPELNNLVVLDIQWLTDMFKKIVTVRRYDPYYHEGKKFKELWRKLETTGILEETLLEHVWSPLLDNRETIQGLVAIMERFTLLFPWPSSDTSDTKKQYLVPSMLMSYPPDDVMKLVASARIPSLFITFVYSQIPMGLFSRLVIQFFREFRSPLPPWFYRNFARFYTSDDSSVILLCHSFSIEVVVHQGRLELDGGLKSTLSTLTDANPNSYDVVDARTLRRKLELILECMRREYPWLKHMKYEVSFLCPVCCQGGAVHYCRTHQVQGCKQEACLHFWSEGELSRGTPTCCTRAAFAVDNRINTRQFEPWLENLDTQVRRIGGRLPFVEEVTLPDRVLQSLLSPSCDAKEVIVQLNERLHLYQDSPERRESIIRSLANKAKELKRRDVFQHLREITPAGSTGPLLPEHLDIEDIPVSKRRELTIGLSGLDEWNMVAESLGLTPAEIRFFDKRVLDPFDAVLSFAAKQRHISVGELYDLLIECGMPVLADLL